MKIALIVFFLIAFGSVIAAAQPKAKGTPTPEPAALPNVAIRSSAAFAELLLRETDLESDLASLVMEYTEDYPKVKEKRFSLTLVKKEIERMLSMKPAETPKLTLALGKMLVRRTELETDLWALRNVYTDDHPEVKQAKEKVTIYTRAIDRILN